MIIRTHRPAHAGSMLAGFLLSACFDSSPTQKGPVELITAKTWRVQSVTYDLGQAGIDGLEFGLGKTMLLGGDSMLVLADSQPPDTGIIGGLFTSRNCYYGVQWENPGACLQDDIWTFSRDSSLAVGSGSILCDSAQASVSSGKWSLKPGGAEIGIRLAGDSAVFRVEFLSGSELRWSETALDTAGNCGRPVPIRTIYSFIVR